MEVVLEAQVGFVFTDDFQYRAVFTNFTFTIKGGRYVITSL